MTTLTEEQAQHLLRAAQGQRLEALYVLALATGMRQGELLALRWRDIDLESASLHVRSTLHYTPDGYVFAEPKTKFSRRTIALSPIAINALRAHHLRQVEERLRTGRAWDDLDLVFPNSVGRPIDGIHLLKYWFYPLLERAGLPRMRFHDLRPSSNAAAGPWCQPEDCERDAGALARIRDAGHLQPCPAAHATRSRQSDE